jgi:hypothetical protein
MTPAHLLLLFSGWGLAFCPGQSGLQNSYFELPTIARKTGTYYQMQIFFLLRWGLANFCLDWPGTTILPILVNSFLQCDKRPSRARAFSVNFQIRVECE